MRARGGVDGGRRRLPARRARSRRGRTEPPSLPRGCGRGSRNSRRRRGPRHRHARRAAPAQARRGGAAGAGGRPRPHWRPRGPPVRARRSAPRPAAASPPTRVRRCHASGAGGERPWRAGCAIRPGSGRGKSSRRRVPSGKAREPLACRAWVPGRRGAVVCPPQPLPPKVSTQAGFAVAAAPLLRQHELSVGALQARPANHQQRRCHPKISLCARFPRSRLRRSCDGTGFRPRMSFAASVSGSG